MQPLILHLLYLVLINIIIVSLGYVFINRKMVLPAWLLLILSILIVHLLFIKESPIIRMLALIATTFTAMKVVAVAKSYQLNKNRLSFKQWFAFALGWAGMREQPFETLGGKPLPNAGVMVWFGISRVIAGGLLIALAHIIVSLNLNHTFIYICVSSILLVGLSLILHFGLLSISAGMWRFSGANTYYLFKQPAKATSLTEFWSKRWNLAFTEMTSIAIFRPLRNRIGGGAALMLAFAFSGLLHEIALSVPVNSGYGLPMLYFIIQGILVLLEKVMTRNKIMFLQHKIIGRVWIFFWLIAPAPLLFHTQFIKEIVWPLAGLK
ncbi:MAG: membrane bound O-acyl transferase family-domain-containing protein [Bacteroidota bacterium]